MDGSNSRISLKEFIASNYLSEVNLQFNGISISPQPCSSNSEGSSIQSGKNLLHCLNATKLALLLAKTFLKTKQNSDKEGNNIESLQLDHFLVNFQLGDVSPHKNFGKSGLQSNSSLDLDLSSGVLEMGFQSNCSLEFDHFLSGVFDGSNQDLNIDATKTQLPPNTNALVSEIVDDRSSPKKVEMNLNVLDISIHPASKSASDQSLTDVSLPVLETESQSNSSLDFDHFLSEVLDDSKQDLNVDATKTQLPPNTNALGSEIVDDRISPKKVEMTLNVLDIGIHPASKSASNQSLIGVSLPRKIPQMQILGNHIHAIYSGNKQQSLSLIDHTVTSKREDEASGERSSKQRMFKGNSFFSTLLEMGDYPVSVCRLLSDMIGGDDEHADNPFTSFDEVIQDLEQMSNHPQIFLHDQSNDFYSSNLHFGKGCYGREKELTKLLEISTRIEQSSLDGSEAVFVSGVAGCGKTFFVQNVARFLTNLGWTVHKVKFQREMNYGSREIVSSLFEKLVANIVQMKSSNDEADIDYNRQATEAISDALDPTSLSSLATFIPSIQELFPDTGRCDLVEADMSLWHLVFLLSKLMGATLSVGRYILMVLDDLQWCDSSMLVLIKEIIISLGQNEQGRQHFLFVGMYRDNEIFESHPIANQLTALQKCRNVHVTEIKLSSLSRDEVADMIMSEIRLPRRLVCGIADVVHKKTSGHSIFVVQLLNSLVRDSKITYSPRKHRFICDENEIATLRTWDSVASLIVSNLSSLQAEALQSLRILSCFGVQISLSLIKLTEGCPCIPEAGIESFLTGLVEGGVIEVSGSSVSFSHDLIQQHVYDNIPKEEQQRIHLDIGTFIASKIGLDSLPSEKSLETGVEELKFDESNDVHLSISSPSYPQVAIATNQINFVGPRSILDHQKKIRFARWNLCAGKDAAERSNVEAALYFYKSGIAFLGDGLWLRDTNQLCHELHEGSASAYYSMGNHSLAAKQANAVIDNVLFEDSLVSQYILIRSLENCGRYVEAVANGLELLQLLKMDIPSEPSLSVVMRAMAETGRAASAYSFNQITNTRHIVDAKKRNVMKCANALVISFFRSASPYLPLVGCAVVNYSLQNGICDESATAFLILGYYKISLEEKYEEGCYWGDVVWKILAGASARDPSTIQTDIMSTMFLSIYYHPFKHLASRQLKLYQRSMALGEFEMGLHSLHFSLMLSFYSGEKLSLILRPLGELVTTMVKKNKKESAKLALLTKVLIDELVGNSSRGFPVLDGVICDEHSLLADAVAKQNSLLIETIHSRRFNSAFWMGDYTEASKSSRAIFALLSSKMPKIHLVFDAFFMGLIAFKMYRDGEGEEHLDKGKKALDKMKILSNCSTANFGNKLLLLEAEHQASMCNIHAANVAFEESVRSARDHGLVHEQGLACELYGKFLSSIVETDGALYWFKCAHACYMQWGANAKADQVWKDHDLGSSPVGGVANLVNKHGREW